MKRLLLFTGLVCGLAIRAEALPDAQALSTSPKDGVPFTLSEAEAFALQNNPRIAEAQLSTEAVRQVIREVRSGLLPQVTGESDTVGAPTGAHLAAIGELNNPGVYSRQSDGVVINQLLTDFGKTFDLVASATSDARASAERRRTVQAVVLLEVDRAYFQVLRAQALAKVARQTVDSRDLMYRQVNVLMQSQLRSELDTSFAQVDLAKARLMVIQADSDIRQAEADLSDAMGFPFPQHFRLSEIPFNTAVPPSDRPLMLLALSKRPEIAALRNEVQAANQNFAATRKAFYPTIRAMGDAGISPVYDSSGLQHNYYAGGVNVELPIFNGGYLDAQSKRAKFLAQAKAESELEAENAITRDVRQAWLYLVTNAERISVANDLVKSADEALRLASTRYQLGTTSIVELSEAQLNDTQAQIELESAHYDLQIGQAILEFNLGSKALNYGRY